MPEMPPAPEADRATRRSLAVELYNRVWQLLETPHRTPQQDDEMIHAAHASRYHWGEVADTPARLWRGEWQCARVYAVLGRAEPALHHARRCLALLEAGADRAEDWDAATVYEAMARATAVAGDRAASAHWRARAEAACAAIADPGDREVVEHDLATLP